MVPGKPLDLPLSLSLSTSLHKCFGIKLPHLTLLLLVLYQIEEEEGCYTSFNPLQRSSHVLLAYGPFI